MPTEPLVAGACTVRAPSITVAVFQVTPASVEKYSPGSAPVATPPTTEASAAEDIAATAREGVAVLQARPAVERPAKLCVPFTPSCDATAMVQVCPPSAERRMPSP